MLQAFRTTPVLMIQIALLALSVLVLGFVGFLMTRSGVSPRPAWWMFGLMLLIVGPQFIASLCLALRDVKSSAPRTAALEQLANNNDADALRAAVKSLFGRDADAFLTTDARQMFGDAFANAEIAKFATLPDGDTVLLARFKGGFAAEKGWVAYLRVTGLNQLDGVGDSQRGYVVTRPSGDRAFVLHFGDMVGVWTGKDDADIRERMAAGGFDVPRRAPLAGVSPRIETAKNKSSIPTGLAAAFIALNVFIVVLYFFKGAAWAGTTRAKPGVAAVTATELATRLESINALDVPFRIERGALPNEFFATWRYADAKWIDLARARGMHRTFRIRLMLDESSGTVRATDHTASFDWSAGRGGADLEWKAGVGIVFFQYEHKRVFGLQLDEQGRFKPELSYAYTFNLNEMKSPLVEAVTRAGWNWRPTIWQGPPWLRWLTE